jgi:putative heme-binding domain-containing protein
VALAGFLPAAGAGDGQPVVHMLVPGFTVQELPVHLSNINNLRFAPDGRLFALGYDGRIHVLTDSDGDGLEDKDELFWDQPGLSVPVGMAIAPEGVYVSSHGKVSLLKPDPKWRKAVSEEIVASGWVATDVASGGVDAIGVTRDPRGNLYFGLIAADYSNPYRVKDGVSLYDLHGQRGTIQKQIRGGKTLESVANGIRVPYSLAFNKAGDLFCTDQEGETWCPNGNPLDELNQIIPGRNYGFPPIHAKWLPGLQSEAPVVAFGPQHQSTCGLVFNEPHRGQGLFGPKWWEGHAFIAGESRGKIWRVRLVKTPRGYVGKEFLIARLSMLTMDVAISPKGALYVCCHSGQPDWGTGPKGEGKIFKISYTDPAAPQPVLAWAAGPMEARAVFDRPLDEAAAKAVVNTQIEFGDYVRAADRFEQLKPPYKVVKQQDAAPRGKLKIVAARVEGRQMLVLTTDPQPLAVTYALTIPAVKAPGAGGPGATIDMDYEEAGIWAAPDRLPIVSSLPGGRSLAAQIRQNPWLTADYHKPNYPFLYPADKGDEKPFTVAGGDFERGRSLFFSEQIKCAACHKLRGEGGTIGPDLSNLASRDAAAVLHDIKDPSASINPDYVAYNVTLSDGAVMNGFVRALDDRSLRLIGADGKETVFKRAEVQSLVPSSVSLMPAGLLESLKEGQVNDLLTFLLNPPPTRNQAEVTRVLGGAALNRQAAAKPLHLVLVASKQDHGPGQHDYPAWQKKWHGLLAAVPNVTVSDAWLWPTPEQFQSTDVLVFYYWNRDWNAEKYQQLDSYAERGGGMVILHSATIGNPDPVQLAGHIGLSSDSGKTKYLHTPFELKIDQHRNPGLTRGLPEKLQFLDEPYWPLVGDTNQVEVLATTALDGKEWPMMWTYQKGKGRVFATCLGHYYWTLDDPWFRALVLRGLAWSAYRDAGVLEEVATAQTDEVKP